GGGEEPGEFLAAPGAEKQSARIPGPQGFERRTTVDDQLGAGKVEREEGLDVLFDGDAADIEEDRAGIIERRAVFGMEQIGIDALGPKLRIGKTAPFEQRLEVR